MRPLALDIKFPAGPRGVETTLVRHGARFLLLIAPLATLIAGMLRGRNGLISAICGTLLALGNLWLAAILLERGARRSLIALQGAALLGFLGRLAILTLIFFGLRQLAFIDVTVLGLVLVSTHLGLIIAEAWVLIGEDGLKGKPNFVSERNVA